MTPSEAMRLVALHFRPDFPLMWVDSATMVEESPEDAPAFRVRFTESERVYECVVSGPTREDITDPSPI